MGAVRRPSLATCDAPIGAVKQDWLRLVRYQPEAVITSTEHGSSVHVMYCQERDVIGKTWGSLSFGTCLRDYKTAEKLGQIHRPWTFPVTPTTTGRTPLTVAFFMAFTEFSYVYPVHHLLMPILRDFI